MYYCFYILQEVYGFESIANSYVHRFSFIILSTIIFYTHKTLFQKVFGIKSDEILHIYRYLFTKYKFIQRV